MDSQTTASAQNSSGKNKVHMKSVTIILHAGPSGFTDDKDEAKRVRLGEILPALDNPELRVVLDFTHVKSSTQSFVHALLGEALKKHGESVLNRIHFHKCTPLMKSLVQLVVDYSFGGFASSDDSDRIEPKKRPRKKA
jgi:hypothetical protein